MNAIKQLGCVINKKQREIKYQNIMTEELKELKIRRNSYTDQTVYLKTLKLWIFHYRHHYQKSCQEWG